MSRRLLFCAILILLAAGGVQPTIAQDGPRAQPTTYLNLRTGPGEDYDIIATLNPGTLLILEARDELTYWVLVHTDSGAALRGWISTCCLSLDVGVSLKDLPVGAEVVGVGAPPAPPAGNDAGDHQDQADLDGNTAVVGANLRLREGPGEEYATVKLLLKGAAVTVEDKSNPDWVRVLTADGSTGWVSTCCITYGASAAAAPNPGAREAELIAKLSAVPIVPSGISGRVRQIFAQGQAMGNRPGVFSKVGDCMTQFHAFLIPFGAGEYTLGGYAYLQPTIDFFNATEARYGSANSFVNESMVAEGGFSAPSVLDPLWAKPDHCQAGETPLACEYRLLKPGVAIILFGAVDVHYLPPAEFGRYLRQIVDVSIAHGVIPVLNTIPANKEYMWAGILELNSVVVDIAQEYGVPLINLWRATQDLPDGGIDTSDYLHLSFKGDRWASFTGDEQRWGYTLRNLVTLQTLDMLRAAVLQ
ncbi:MAG: SH3 domain-containing protein [Anaerolineae bacterium]|nr:SH3 domain-containing protein [Anaerolineae bacterium]